MLVVLIAAVLAHAFVNLAVVGDSTQRPVLAAFLIISYGRIRCLRKRDAASVALPLAVYFSLVPFAVD